MSPAAPTGRPVGVGITGLLAPGPPDPGPPAEVVMVTALVPVGAGGETGQTVVYKLLVSVVTEPTGQSVTVGGHEVMV